jgi:hypothetical protein
MIPKMAEASLCIVGSKTRRFVDLFFFLSFRRSCRSDVSDIIHLYIDTHRWIEVTFYLSHDMDFVE